MDRTKLAALANLIKCLCIGSVVTGNFSFHKCIVQKCLNGIDIMIGTVKGQLFKLKD